MRLNSLVLVLGLTLLGSSNRSFGEEKKSPKAGVAVGVEKSVPPVMYEFLGEMVRLQPYMPSEARFSDLKDEKEIQKHLKNLADLSKRLSHSERLNTSSFQITGSTVQDHLAKLSLIFSEGRKEYARRMLGATLTGCAACHMQVPSQKSTWKFRTEELQGTHFDKAEFLFAVRHYDEALEHFDEYLASATKNSGRNPQMAVALNRKLAIFVRIRNEPDAAVVSFEKNLKNPNLQPRLKAEVNEWIPALKGLKGLQAPDPAKSMAAVEAFAAKTLQPLMSRGLQFEPKHYVTFLYVSGLLYQTLNQRPATELTPGVLYWLAICDTRLNQNFFFSFNDLYLKECIKRFPSSEMAEKCYDELESMTEVSFTGSAGVEIPADVKGELDKYKSMLKPKL